ncbi:MAG: NifB/NifX family molybdenum-iron cluster-binding protein [Candidatus Njordarchaeia archaeon]
MRIAVPSDGDNLDAQVFEHFGRAPYYIIVDIEDSEIKSVKAVPNPSVETHNPGDLPLMLADEKVDVLIARGVGRRALAYFQELGIDVITGAYGKIRDIVEKFVRGELSSTPYQPKEKWGEDH